VELYFAVGLGLTGDQRPTGVTPERTLGLS
jgi:hypothetical protein